MRTPKLLQNVATLGGFQVANMLLTLVMIPYVTRVLGVESWGRVVFVQLVVNYLVWLCNWGFYLGGTRKVAEHRGDTAMLTDVFTATFVAQWLLTAAAVVVVGLLLIFVPFFSMDRALYLWGVGLLIGNALLPVWFLNGLERIKDVVVIQLITKALSIPLILLLVNEGGDGHLYIAANAAASIVVGAATVAWIRKKMLATCIFPAWTEVFATLKESAGLFASTLWANLYGSVTPTLLGIVAGPSALGIYNLADRARGAAITIGQPISYALFPRMCYLFAKDRKQAKLLLMRSGAFLFVFSGMVSAGLWLYGEEVLYVLGGEEFADAYGPLRWLAATPLLTTVSAFFTHQIIIPAQKNRFYSAAMFATLVIAVVTAYPAIYWWKAEGAAMVIFVSELFLLLVTMVYLLKHDFFLKVQQG